MNSEFIASMVEKDESRAVGGRARAEALTPDERKEIARKAAEARWGKKLPVGEMPEATRDGLISIGEVDIDCFHLPNNTRLIHKRAIARALGMKSDGGNALMKTLSRKGIGSAIPEDLWKKINNPIVFKPISGDPAHGYEATVFIEICDAIWQAGRDGKLTKTQDHLAKQAEIIIRSSAKLGIIALIDEATGYIRDKRREEYKELFKEFIADEMRGWEKEFPDQFFDIWYRLYKIPKGKKGRHPQFFGKLVRKYIYAPLANSNGAILEQLEEKNPIVYKNGGRKYKMHMFLSDEIGVPAFRAHLWQVVGIGQASKSKEAMERNFRNAFPEAGDQVELDL